MISNNFESCMNNTTLSTSTTTNTTSPIKINSNNSSPYSISPLSSSPPKTTTTTTELLSSSYEINKKNNNKFSKIKTLLKGSGKNKSSTQLEIQPQTPPIFDNLPSEVIEKIFSYLFEYDIYRVSLVCNYWNQITKSNDIWLNIYKKRSYHCELLKQNVKEIDFKSVLKLHKSVKANWKNGKFKSTVLTGHTESISSILFTGNKILSSSRDQTLKVWDYYTNECIKTFNNKSIINCMEKDFENKRIACGTLNGFLNVYNLETSTLEHSEKAHHGFIVTLKANNDSSIFCSGSKDKDIKLWKFNDLNLIDIDDSDEFSDFGLVKQKNNDNNHSSNNNNNNKNNNFSTTSTLLLKKLGSHELTVNNIEWCNYNNNHVWSSGGKTIKQWDIESGQLITTYSSPSRIINSGCLSVKNGMVACAGEGPISIWDSRMDIITPTKTISPESQFIYCLQYEPSLHSLVTGDGDNKVKCFNEKTGTIEQTFLGHTHPVSFINYNPSYIVSSGIDGNIWVWNFLSNMNQSLLINNDQFIHNNSNNFLNEYDSNNNNNNNIINNNNNSNNNNNYSNDNLNNQIKSSNSPRRVGNFHLLNGHRSFIRATFTDETKIISGSHDNSIRVWDFTSSLQKKDHKCNIM
ncbi:hypothetical protein ACTFIV_008345 [Dictyostelium citrinum]